MPLSKTQGLEPLIAALRSPDTATRQEVRAILEDLTGQHLGEDHARWLAWWEAHKHAMLDQRPPCVEPPRELTPDRDSAQRVAMGIPPILYEKYKKYYDLQRLYQPQDQWTPPSPVAVLIGPMVCLIMLGLIVFHLIQLAHLDRIINLGGQP